MNYSIIVYILGWIMNVEAVCMYGSASITALIYREKAGIAFVITILACLAIGVPLVSRKPSKKAFYAREGLVTTALSWIVLSIVGAVPFVLSGAIPNPIDAFFEIVSGFTTTGSSIPQRSTDALQHQYLEMFFPLDRWYGCSGIYPDTASACRWLSYEPYEGRKPRSFRRKASSKSPVNCQDPVQDLHCTHCCTDHPPASWGDASLRQSLCSIWNCRNRWVRNQIRQYGKLQLIYSDRHHHIYDPVWR